MKATFQPEITISASFRENTGPHLQLEDDSGFILLEDGGELLLEDNPLNKLIKATFNSPVTIGCSFKDVTVKATFVSTMTIKANFSE